MKSSALVPGEERQVLVRSSHLKVTEMFSLGQDNTSSKGSVKYGELLVLG